MNYSTEVAKWLDTFESPLKPELLVLRDIMLIDGRITESIKWRAPAFSYSGVLSYFHWKAQQHLSLIFPDGGLIDQEATLAGQPFELLRGAGRQRTLKFTNVEEIALAKSELLVITDWWCTTRAKKRTSQ